MHSREYDSRLWGIRHILSIRSMYTKLHSFRIFLLHSFSISYVALSSSKWKLWSKTYLTNLAWLNILPLVLRVLWRPTQPLPACLHCTLAAPWLSGGWLLAGSHQGSLGRCSGH
jgi:hypothetical protein